MVDEPGLDQQVASLVATEASHYASPASRVDRLESRMERGERRLDPVEPRRRALTAVTPPDAAAP